MTIFQAITAAKQKLDHIDGASIDAYALLSHLLNCGRNELFVNGENKLNEQTKTKYFEMVARRAKHEPVQYITNHCEFMSLSFYVNSNVLIPRPDTEILVEAVIDEFREKKAAGLDLCTGSGCIAVSVAYYCRNVVMLASDISEEALVIAKQNASSNGVLRKIMFVKSDMFAKITRQKKFDFLISNPPYIETDMIKTLGKNVKDYEPKTALDGGSDGLRFYKKIAEQAYQFLNPNASIYLEIGFNQAEMVLRLLHEAGFKKTAVLKDLSGLDRVIIIKT